MHLEKTNAKSRAHCEIGALVCTDAYPREEARLGRICKACQYRKWSMVTAIALGIRTSRCSIHIAFEHPCALTMRVRTLSAIHSSRDRSVTSARHLRNQNLTDTSPVARNTLSMLRYRIMGFACYRISAGAALPNWSPCIARRAVPGLWLSKGSPSCSSTRLQPGSDMG